MRKLKAYSPKSMVVDGDSIYLDKRAIPIKLHNVYAKNNELFIAEEKTVSDLQEQAKTAYNSLSPQEKAELKSAVFSNVNSNDVNIANKMLQK